jgi:hypothetical protein
VSKRERAKEKEREKATEATCGDVEAAYLVVREAVEVLDERWRCSLTSVFVLLYQ